MKLYSENFKKSVVQKVLSEGVVMRDVAKKLHIDESTIGNWKKKYKDEVTPASPDINSIIEECKGKEIDVDLLLEQVDLADKSSDSIELPDVNEILKSGKTVEQYTLHEKIVIIEAFNEQPKDIRGIWLRNHGLYSQYIQLWEKEVFAVSKQKIDKSEELRALKVENKSLKGKLEKSERNEKELKILIELKKKYRDLFVDSEVD